MKMCSILEVPLCSLDQKVFEMHRLKRLYKSVSRVLFLETFQKQDEGTVR